MRLRSITLDNVRRFTDPVRLGPIGDGITLVSQPNESGKSTLFDALQAVFFQRHTSWGKTGTAALQPYSGGPVTVECEVETEGAVWRLRKRWQQGSGGEAKVWRDGVLMHQGDAADQWVADLVQGEGGGPAGLLWVRQGRVSLSPTGTAKEKDAEQAGRRDLLTAISGAMDAVTGGERMDRALEVCRSELDALQTATGRPRTGGAWAMAEAEVADLAERVEALRTQADALHDDLRDRDRARAALALEEDPEDNAARKAALAEAEDALAEARRHQTALSELKLQAQVARQAASMAEGTALRNAALRREKAEAGVAAQNLAEAAEAAARALKSASMAQDAAADRLAVAEATAQSAQAAIQAIAQRQARADLRRRRAEMARRLAEAEAAEAERLLADSAARRGPTAEAAQAVEAAARTLETRRAAAEARAPRVTLRYDPGAPAASLDGKALEDGLPAPVGDGSRIDLPGLGRLSVDLGDAAGATAVQDAEAALRHALAAADVGDLDALRAAQRSQAEAVRRAEFAAQRRDLHAPDGLPGLRDALAALPEERTESEEPAAPDRARAEDALKAAESALDAARRDEAATRLARDAARDAATEAKAAATAARARLQRASAEAAAVEGRSPEADAEAAEMAVRAAEAAEERLAAHQRDAPDPQAAEVTVTRLRKAAEQADQRRIALRMRLVELDTRIDSRAEAGVEEALTEAETLLAASERRRDSLLREKDVLLRLRTALETAQSAARDRYFAPVAQELRPLLQDMWGDADILWSDETLLPRALVRRGSEEQVDLLSGGTQEQIALLVRLAFARLLARAGRHAPLILDDALVFTDDDRIARLFDALQRASADLQILVLTCRQRAFRDLGAAEVTLEPVAPD